MRASDAHVYLTVPFVLSWSLLDAMACGCLLVASDTAPVREFVDDGVTGLLVPPHDPAALAARIDAALDAPRRRSAGCAARARAQIVETLDARRVIWPKKRAWLEAAAAGGARRRGGSRPAAAAADRPGRAHLP